MANDNHIWHQRLLITVRELDTVYKLSWLRKSVNRKVEYHDAIGTTDKGSYVITGRAG